MMSTPLKRNASLPLRDAIQLNEQWYILATSSRTDDRTRVLKHGETFALFDRYGDIQPIGSGEQGLYHEGTRFLSYFELLVNGRRPLLLHSTVKADNSLLVADLTNPDLYLAERRAIPKGTFHIFRAKLLWEGVHHEHIRLVNYGDTTVDIELELRFAADYADIFEVRGVKRSRRGEMSSAQTSDHELLLSYRGLDDVMRRTRIAFSMTPETITGRQSRFRLPLSPQAARELYITIACEGGARAPAVLTYDQARAETEAAMAARRQVSIPSTSNEQFNDWINRSAADLQMLISQTPQGRYPYAGVPWFSTPFGRDGIITALQFLWLDPSVAQGALGFLAATQAEEENPAQDAEPGKIVHEIRGGEMAALGEVPFRRYYGSVDATPLFIILADAYYQRTGDRPFLETLWPAIERALQWIDRYGDSDGDGFVEYARRSATGLVQQGWKDSNDSVFHQDGNLAQGPIALCEVQGYVYRAKRAAAKLATLLGHSDYGVALERQAAQLKRRFNEAFWCPDIATFALALDGDKRPCRVRSSNVGHVLFSGIADFTYARQTAETLLCAASFSGWGVRTLANAEHRYNPMSYHNGSVWPHDNAIVAMGLARYGFKGKAMQILTGMFDASIVMEFHRLPELFCGFDRLPGQEPTLYPVACSPQAWASGSVFYLLQACLGLTFSPEKPQVRFHYPQLPPYLHELQLKNFRIGGGVIDLVLRRHARDVGINVSHKEGDVEVAINL